MPFIFWLSSSYLFQTSTSITFTFLIKNIENTVPTNIITVVNTYIVTLFKLAFITILHINEAISTAETMVVGIDFFINPIPTAATPILAAMRDMIRVFSTTFSIMESVKSFPTR